MEMIKYKLAIVLSLCLTVALTQATDVNYCNKKAYAVKVKGVDISPFPISRGKETTFSISATAVLDVPYLPCALKTYTQNTPTHIIMCIYIQKPHMYGEFSDMEKTYHLDEAISGGKLVIDVSYFGWSIHSETHDLCDETSCPVTSGDFIVAHSQVLPGFTPPGSYSLKMRMLDGNKHELTCITFDFSIGFVSVADS
ncbi:hypothetical protein JRO89_XSUnG0213300 [Xanthoceras sorbifolium]|uniref:MD-2-related lipid-recognition domain-containing protein n=1 Tax=Xanthoceras sorbifolium TaxID=99658 RepID=A0ABQ8GXI2_9ROSI|nr:hypothetical protein JRO89_XSUnG0213300 [Xanthoceras sorbifolium]